MAKVRKPERHPVVEWVSAAVGLLITLTLFGLLAFEAIRQREGVPPLLEAAPTGLTAAGGRYFVEIEVENRSRTTGAGVQVEGTLKRGGSGVETSTATLSYVPGESRRRAGLVFTKDPRQFDLELRVTGYEHP